jgi:hypothetical protein
MHRPNIVTPLLGAGAHSDRAIPKNRVAMSRRTPTHFPSASRSPTKSEDGT